MSAVPTAHPPLAAGLTIANGAAMIGTRERRVEIRCGRCSYGGVVRRLPERCPMCGGDEWTTLPAKAAVAAPAGDARP
jgi:Zn finger protein HypA/HybF involved in hydrogenase expression